MSPIRPIVITLVVVTLCANFNLIFGFHLSFGNRLIKSVSNTNAPQLNPASTLIRPIECKNANNQSEAGICMFSIDCMQNKGVPLSICKHNYFVGTCCRLPDHNNFVGIVYDLRDTDSNHFLEARRITVSTPVASTEAVQASTINHSEPAQTTTTAIPFPTIPATSGAPSTAIKGAELSPFNGNSIEDRYIISSTSLFPSTTTQASSIYQQRLPSASSPMQPPIGESARNADGSSGNLLLKSPSKNQMVVPSELDSFQIQTTLVNGTFQHQQVADIHQAEVATKLGNHISYELIKQNDGSSIIMQASDLSPVTVVNSAHSPVGPQSNSFEQRKQEEVIPSSTSGQLGNAESVYNLIDDPQGKQNTQQQQNVVLANNHQASSTSRPSTASSTSKDDYQPSESPAIIQTFASSSTLRQQEPAGSGDQEFTLTSAVAGASESPVSGSIGVSTSSGELTSKLASNGGNQSTFVDLVSASDSSQPTTPFTTSLSTASLPNVSSQPYSPTTIAPLVPDQSFSNFSSSTTVIAATTKPSSAASTQTSPTSTTTTTTTARPSTASSSDSIASLGFSQLYSSSSHQAAGPQHQQQQQLAQVATLANHLHNNLKPSSASSGLQPATKIVSGGPNSNNLIPGLSGLQSAILSHIPFKLASGLSSYLQAAMKPAGSRPVMSSNNAPASQYQLNKAGNSSTIILTSNGGIKFPTIIPISTASSSTTTTTTTTSAPASSSADSSMILSSVAGQNDQQRQAPVAGWQFAPVASTLSPMLSGDIVRDAQLVCGRPQAPAPMSSPSDKKRVARIVGGNQSLFGQWPWMVSLRQWRKGAFLHKCGAALLNENWAITAAHCVEKGNFFNELANRIAQTHKKEIKELIKIYLPAHSFKIKSELALNSVKASDLLLRLGEFDVSNQDEPYPFIERRVKQVVSHPSFDSKTFEYDLALLKFSEPIKYERNVLPVCVPSGNDTYVDRMATVIGWGRLYEDGPLPDIIQHVDVPIITNNECEKMYKNAGYIEEIPEMFICAGISKGGRDSCEGDSGGPLTMVDNDGRSYLVGIISWGIGCALPSQPGVYTRITAFSGWINQITAF